VSPRPPIDHIRKPQILEAAAAVITERGLEATRVADVADRAGTSPSAVLYWFGSRDELLTAALVADEDRFAHLLGERLARLEGAEARLRLLIDLTVEDPDISLWIETWARALHDPTTAAERYRLDTNWWELIASLIAAGQIEGVFAADIHPGDAALAIACLLDGLAVQVTLGTDDVAVDRMRSLALKMAGAVLGAEIGPREEPASP
jgi:AcrR family transcriptional regulator